MREAIKKLWRRSPRTVNREYVGGPKDGCVMEQYRRTTQVTLHVFDDDADPDSPSLREPDRIYIYQLQRDGKMHLVAEGP